jgi:glycosyltransferase involved in cell wall biosynthesis
VQWLLEHPAEYAAIASAGQRMVEEKLTWEHSAKGILDLVVVK